jgi:hypothetical protein
VGRYKSWVLQCPSCLKERTTSRAAGIPYATTSCFEPKAKLQLQKALPQKAACTGFCHQSSHCHPGQRGSNSFPWWPSRRSMTSINMVLYLHMDYHGWWQGLCHVGSNIILHLHEGTVTIGTDTLTTTPSDFISRLLNSLHEQLGNLHLLSSDVATLSPNTHFSGWVSWLMPVISVTWEVEIGGSWFKDSPGKKLGRLYFKKQAECGYVPCIPAI